ncbi:MAG: hypothetical protein M1834_003415 [Cirrosporium novae-zelandiae]|nr:MAG: hypothetical protein M1834_003415 [Cirrosporium novae-zelandiae]
MTTEEDNFDIDIYGDGGGDYQGNEHNGSSIREEAPRPINGDSHTAHESSDSIRQNYNGNSSGFYDDGKTDNNYVNLTERQQSIVDADKHAQNPKLITQQGIKRKDGPDERPLDPGATTALFLGELHWWTTDDDIRGWINDAGCEAELKDVTFSEHKVNGKSKGQAFVEFASPQAATAAKHKIDSLGKEQQPSSKKYSATYTNPFTNPFRTLPKDAPTRGKDGTSHRSNSGAFNASNIGGPPQNSISYGVNNMNSGGYRGGRGNYNNRGNSMNVGGYNNRSFSGALGGYQGGPLGGFSNPQMGNMQPYGGYQGRGGMMGGMRGGPGGMRGSRGGMPGGMMSLPMGGMNMGNMPGQMGGMGMGGNMPMQGQGGFSSPSPHFNPAFFSQNTPPAAGDGSWNPHGAKRTRQE